uniref:Uncharacterized protein n=1 Tax=Anguilla anguilla TaxID=7936 RepID=A0A0E9XTE9_ANGAN
MQYKFTLLATTLLFQRVQRTVDST